MILCKQEHLIYYRKTGWKQIKEPQEMLLPGKTNNQIILTIHTQPLLISAEQEDVNDHNRNYMPSK